MVDNFEQIKKLLTFNSDDEFYFVQILQRKKDNPGGVNGSNNSSRLIKAYYITSLEQLDRDKEEMIFFANHFNARVGINLNKRSFYKTAFNTLKHIAEQMHNKDFKQVKRAWNTSCGIHNGGDKIWLLDVDKLEDWIKYNGEKDRYNQINTLITNSQPYGHKCIAKIPSKNGYHLLVTAFDTREFVKKFPEIEIHKNNPTNLYIP